MTPPTKGMVAGQPITTGAQTKEWDEGFARTFGERKPVRGRFLYTSGGVPLPQPVEVTEDWKQPDSGPSCVSEAEVYGGLPPTTDGADVSSRTKHREYMKRNGLALTEDYTESWAKAQKERDAFRKGESQSHQRELADDVGRALYEARRRGR